MTELKTINEKLNFIQTTLKAPKGQRNNFGKYNYRSCEDIMEAVKPILGATGCTLTIQDEIVLVGERYYVKATSTLNDGHGMISVTAFAREDENRKGMDSAQLTGATSSYARKYSLNGLFCIDDTKDSDTTNTRGKEEKPNAKPVTPPKVTSQKPKAVAPVKPKAPETTDEMPPELDEKQTILNKINSFNSSDEINKYWDSIEGVKFEGRVLEYEEWFENGIIARQKLIA